MTTADDNGQNVPPQHYMGYARGKDPTNRKNTLVRDCSCRGEAAGFAHISCLVDYAEQNIQQWDGRDPLKFSEPWREPFLAVTKLMILAWQPSSWPLRGKHIQMINVIISKLSSWSFWSFLTRLSSQSKGKRLKSCRENALHDWANENGRYVSTGSNPKPALVPSAIEYCEKARYNYEVLGATSVVAEVELYLAQLKSQH